MNSALTTQRVYVIAVLAGIIGALGDAFLNCWAKRENSARWIWFIAGFSAWNIALFLFSRLLVSTSLAQAVILFLVTNSVAVSLVSLLYFREPLSFKQWFGFAVAVLGTLLLESK